MLLPVQQVVVVVVVGVGVVVAVAVAVVIRYAPFLVRST